MIFPPLLRCGRNSLSTLPLGHEVWEGGKLLRSYFTCLRRYFTCFRDYFTLARCYFILFEAHPTTLPISLFSARITVFLFRFSYIFLLFIFIHSIFSCFIFIHSISDLEIYQRAKAFRHYYVDLILAFLMYLARPWVDGPTNSFLCFYIELPWTKSVPKGTTAPTRLYTPLHAVTQWFGVFYDLRSNFASSLSPP